MKNTQACQIIENPEKMPPDNRNRYISDPDIGFT